MLTCMRIIAVVFTVFASTAATAMELWPGTQYDPKIPSYATALGYDIGEMISDPTQTRDYFEALAQASNGRMQLFEYGTTWEGRKLFFAVIGNAEQMADLAGYQSNMQRLANAENLSDAELKSITGDTPGSVWLAYSVHGNEISSTDAAMATAYHLLAAKNDPVVEKILASTLVFIAPIQNPDGRARFVQEYRMNLGLEPQSDPLAAERNERWPSGRVNHYLFDLNRDWLALTQPETRGHVAALRDWLPLVVVDLHEMGSDSTYYFAPEAVPFNPHLTDTQRSSLEIFGRNNARWFDEFGFDYFTREIFDAFYPGYGASWPALYGAVAMTYEQASPRGRIAKRTDGTEFTYRDAVQQHFVTSVSTAQAVAENHMELLRNFRNYRVSARREGSRLDERFYVISGADKPGQVKSLGERLQLHGIEVQKAQSGFRACGKSIDAHNLVVDLAQPEQRMIRSLLDPQVDMESDFLAEQERRRSKDLPDEIYDVTAWSLPLMQGLELTACNKISATLTPFDAESYAGTDVALADAEFGIIVPWGDISAIRFLTAALRDGVSVRTVLKPFANKQRSFPAGSLVISRKTNENFDEVVANILVESGAQAVPIADSWITEGPNFGSMNAAALRAPNIAIAWDQPTNAYSAGNTRYVIERQLGYPVTPIRTQNLNSSSLTRFDVLILPESWGSYGGTLNKAAADNLNDWVRSGGVLIAVGNALTWAADPEVNLVALRREEAATDKDAQPKSNGKEESKTVPGKNIADEDAYLAMIEPDKESPDTSAGAIVKAVVDSDYALAAGTARELNVLYRGNDIYQPLSRDEGVNIVYFKAADELLASGYLWQNVQEQLAFKPFVTMEQRGRGLAIAFTEDPNVRAYLDGLNVIFANALFIAPSQTRKLR